MKEKIRRKSPILWGVITAVFLGLAILTIRGNTALLRTEILISEGSIPDGFRGFRIAQVSDLHNAQFGAGNERLLALLADARPDMIAITGDLVDSRHTDVAVALDFVKQASEIAPCYYVTGNHEARLSEYPELERDLLEAGVTVLRDENLTLEREGGTIRLLGLSDPAFGGDPAEALSRLMEEEEGYSVLLSHRPELFALYCEAGVDLALTGHAHGGQIRLPGIGGLFAPGQGFFPRYDGGLYGEGQTRMVVSRGLGNSLFPFRVNNRPEVVLVILGGK